MSYVSPPEFVAKMVDAGQSKALMGTRDTLIRGYMAGPILALAAGFAVTITVQTGNALIGALLVTCSTLRGLRPVLTSPQAPWSCTGC